MITILSGKSATGKDELFRRVVATGYYIPIVSTTTRPIREGEIEGRDYFYVSRQKFMDMILDDMLIEYRSYNTLVNNVPDTWYYGVSKQEFSKSKQYIVVLEPQGIQAMLDKYGSDNVIVYYLDCERKTRRERAEKRGSFDVVEWKRREMTDDHDFRNINDLADIVIDTTNLTAKNVFDIFMANGLTD